MTIFEARLIREVKKQCTYRRLAEIYYHELHPGHGNQGYGDELCFEAFKVLYPEILFHPFEVTKDMMRPKFNEENKSYLGDYYWWE